MDRDDINAAAHGLEGMLPIAKATVLEARATVQKMPGVVGERDGVRSNQVSRDDYGAAFTNLGALDPIYDPEMLALIFEHSNSLRQNVDAYSTNIDGFGHRFDPVIDLEASDVRQRIAHALQFERQRESGDIEAPDPTPEEVEQTLQKLARRMRLEKTKLQHFFERCCPDMSFVSLRRITRQDLEVMGNAYWEVLRNRKGEIVQFVYVPAFTVRLLPLDPTTTQRRQRVRVSDLSFEDMEVETRLRRYVQIVEGRAVFFKELGDPRLISSQSGLEYSDIGSLQSEEPGARPATEMMHFKVHSPRSAYGVPRWVGNLLAVIGSRQSEEVNFNYFENKSVPPLAVLVSGGRMTADSVSRVTDYIESHIKGKRNFHKILVLEAESGGGSASDANASKMKIDIRPLTGAQHNDALFQVYDERNIDKVGQSFRLPRMLRGDIRDFNRATADAALTFAEVQVFEPERQEFDFLINRKLLTEIGILYWRFVSLAPVIRDAVAMSEIIRNLSNANVLTPEEGRELAGDVFNRDFKHINAAWVRQPGAFTIAGIPVEETRPDPIAGPSVNEPNFGPAGGEIAPTKPPAEGLTARARAKLGKSLQAEAARLIAVKQELENQEARAWSLDLIAKAKAGES